MTSALSELERKEKEKERKLTAERCIEPVEMDAEKTKKRENAEAHPEFFQNSSPVNED